MKPFTLNINLDDESECIAFLRRHMIHPGPTGRRLANFLGWKGRHSGKAAKALWNYAANKHTAITLRRNGDINTALQYESICDRIYDQTISRLVECW